MKNKKQPKVTFFGVGNAGCTVLDKLAKSDLHNNMKFVAVNGKNTNIESCNADIKIILNADRSAGLHNDLTVVQARKDAVNVFAEIKAAMIGEM